MAPIRLLKNVIYADLTEKSRYFLHGGGQGIRQRFFEGAEENGEGMQRGA